MLTEQAARFFTRKGHSSRWMALFAFCGAASAGCFKPDDGREPPLDRIYFPVGLALSPDGDRLYVANSDWDLQFNAGSVQAYDAARLRELLPRSCDDDSDCPAPQVCETEVPSVDGMLPRAATYLCVDPETRNPCPASSIQPASDRLLEPGLCGAIDNRTQDLLLEGVRVGAFATDLIYRANPSGGGRLFVPVRSDATLHWIDVRGGLVAGGPDRELACGQSSEGECDSDHRRGDDSGERSPLGEGLPIEPYGIDASADGETIVVSHQTEGKVSLFVNDWSVPGAGPTLQFVLEDLPGRPVDVSAVPVPEIAREADRARERGYSPGFWLAFRLAPFVQLVRYVRAEDAPDGRAFLARAFADRLSTTSSSDVRGMAADASVRTACELGCSGDIDCLTDCAGIAVDVFLANRSPASLLVGNTTSIRRDPVGNDRLQVSDVIPIDPGPSKVVVGAITDENGELRRRVFITSFDSRSVTIYDPEARAIEARVLAGRGPTALAIDSERALAYVAHFTDSYIGVIDLDRRHRSYGSIILALGEPSAPRGDR